MTLTVLVEGEEPTAETAPLTVLRSIGSRLNYLDYCATDYLVVAVMILAVVCSVLTVIQFSQGIQTVSSKTMYPDLELDFKVIISMYELSCRIIIFRGMMMRTSTN